MEAFLKALQTLPETRELRERVEGGGCPAAVIAAAPVQRACLAWAVAAGCGRPMVFVCADEAEGRQTAGDIAALTGTAPVVLPERQWQLRPGAVADRTWEGRRIAALHRLASGRAEAVVATVDALMARTLPPGALKGLGLRLAPGERAVPQKLAGKLLEMGYSRCQQVEGPGQFALRGGILDVFSPGLDRPVRCDFFDEEIDALGLFDPATQRRTENIPEARLLPAAEVLPALCPGGTEALSRQLTALAETYEKKAAGAAAAQHLRQDAQRFAAGMGVEGIDRYLSLIYPQGAWGLDYLPPESIVFLCGGSRVDQRVKSAHLQLRQDVQALMEAGVMTGEGIRQLYPAPETLYGRLADAPLIEMDALPTSRHPVPPKGILTLPARQLSAYGGSLDTAAAELKQYREGGFGVMVLCSSQGRAKELLRLLQERDIPAVPDRNGTHLPAPGQVCVGEGTLSAGCEWPSLRLAVLTEGQLTAAPGRKPPRAKKVSGRQRLRSYTDLSPGDLVVHIHHGVGRFAGLRRMPVDGVEKDYIKLDYAGGDSLYVPVTQLDLVSKYIGGGGDEDHPRIRLNKLGGSEWARQKTRAKKAAADLAESLTQLYAQRQRQPGFAFSPDSPWQAEFEQAFPYAETDDQLRAAAEIKADMEKPRPMDRLLCGDVGYGKTEVALRAVMKCILDGKQAALLAPTTVLAQQHYATACGRFRGFPVKVEVLSRFTAPREQKRILSAVASGRADLLIGTHKLLQKGLAFKDLGLLVIDEEQRFGVSHKERLKEISRQVDVLTLSATPIPRTLNMALSGLRDMSSIEEPPADRQPVQTYVLEHDWAIVEDACRRELGRGGQVYYLHNRVETVDLTASRLQKLLGPEVRVVTGHGQMDEQALSAVMQAMVDAAADVLVCTTIIESGIDIPNVNTLIVDDADRLGLAQLHQLRGRIGRSARRAYAYLTYRRGKLLPEAAAKRLTAIREYVEFGSGFKIAMRDLEIRGAGNLLGPEQSGYLMSVGYDLYLKLLEEAVLEQRGEERDVESECAADLTVNAHIPEAYVPAPEQRMDLYRRIAAIRTDEDAADLLDELLDRYGETPKSVLALLDVALLRAAAGKAGVSDITQKKDALRLTLARFQPEAVVQVCALGRYRRRLTLSAGEVPKLTLKLAPGDDVLEQARELVAALHSAGT